jgi:endonuclease/exonuclease/phosphatase family metal-dependent hydrolase
LRVVHWNVHHAGRRTDGVVDRDGLTRWMASFRADVFSLNELDSLANLRDIVTRLERHTGVNWHYSYDYGIAVVSRLPLESQSSCLINSSLGRRIAQATIMVNGRRVNIWSVHHDAYSARTRQAEVTATRACAAGFAEPRIIAGDFNAQSGSPEIRLMATDYTDAWATARRERTATNYAGNCDGCTRRSRIDYVFSSNRGGVLGLRSAEIFDTRDRRGVMPSDHKPMLVVYDVR